MSRRRNEGGMQNAKCKMQNAKCTNAFRLLTNPYSKKRYVKVHKKVKQLCLHLQSGVQGRSPCKKDDVILRARILAFGKWQFRLLGIRLHFPSENRRKCPQPLAPGRCVALQRTYSLPKANSGSSCRAHLQARRGACTEWFNVHNRKTKVKRSCSHF